MSRLIRNFRLDEFRQQGKRFLPAEIAGLGRNHRGHTALRDVELSPAGYLLRMRVRLVSFFPFHELLELRTNKIGPASLEIVPGNFRESFDSLVRQLHAGLAAVRKQFKPDQRIAATFLVATKNDQAMEASNRIRQIYDSDREKAGKG
jgi:hypothetical protein